jgi:predicted permease
MSRFDGWLHRLRVLWRGEHYAGEQRREMEFHLELETLANASHDPQRRDDATRNARRAFGNVTYYREEARLVTTLRLFDRLAQDTRYALRGIPRSPAFTTVVVITLALGFGVNAAMYSLLDTLFLRAPDGVVHPDGIRRVYQETHAPRSGQLGLHDGFEYAQFADIVDVDSTLALAFSTPSDSITVLSNGARIAALSQAVSHRYFALLGLRPQLGRFFLPEDDSLRPPTFVAVISDQLWRSRFGAAPSVIGKQVTIRRRPMTIVGVAPAHFRGVDLDASDVWISLGSRPPESTAGASRMAFWWNARLLARVNDASDEARLKGVVRNVLRADTSRTADPKARALLGPIVQTRPPADATPGTGTLADKMPEIGVAVRISAIALIVLIIAAANVINLLLLRAARRRREMAVRRALGVSTGRLIGQLAIESVLLSLLGAAAAVLVGMISGSMLRRLVLPTIHWARPSIDAHAVAFLVLMSLIVGVVAGLVPAFQNVRSGWIDALRAGQRDAAYRSSRLRSSLLVAQVALCVVLVVGAGLFLQSLETVRAIDIGYAPDAVTVFQPSFVDGPEAHAAALRDGLPAAAEQLRHVPGVAAAGFAQGGPMTSLMIWRVYLPNGDTLPHPRGEFAGTMNVVSPDFFDAAGMHIVRGRGFTPADAPDASGVMIVNETMARVTWPTEDPIGKCLLLGQKATCSTVVGIASDARRLKIIEPRSMAYYVPTSQPPDGWPPAQVLIVRANHGLSERVALEAQRILTATIPGMDGVDVSRMSEVVDTQVRPWRLGAVLFTAFGVLALVVAGVGVYSVTAYAVAQRANEIGIRIALGARTSEIMDLVLSEGLRVVAVGIVIGVVASLALGRVVQSLLFGVSANDPSSMLAATVTLCVLTGVACAVPALRASRVDPVAALRSE